jgi:hypothetical protein
MCGDALELVTCSSCSCWIADGHPSSKDTALVLVHEILVQVMQPAGYDGYSIVHDSVMHENPVQAMLWGTC